MAQLGRAQPLKTVMLRGSSAPGTKLATLQDDFQDGIVDTTKWPGNYGTYFETGGFAVVSCDTGFSGYQSGTIYSLIESEVVVQVYSPVAGGSAGQAYAEVNVLSDQQPVGTLLSIQLDAVNSLIWAFNLVGFAEVTTASSVAFTPGASVWVRMTETAGQVSFYTSTSGNPASWGAPFRTIATTPAWATTSAVKLILQAHRSAGTNDFASFDNVNLSPTDPTASPKVYTPWSAKRLFPLPPGGKIRRGLDARVPPSAITAVGLDGSLQVPLSVRITSDTTDVLLVTEVKDLTFRSVANGGFASCTITLDRPLNVAVPEIKQYGRVYVYDTRTGDTLWEGRLEDPGKSSNTSGTLWQVTAVGPSAHSRDDTFAYVPIGSSLDEWEKFGGSTSSSTISNTTDSSDNDGIKVQFAGGIAVATPVYVSARLLTVANAGTSLAVVSCVGDGGGSGQWEERVYAYGPGSPDLIGSTLLTTSDTAFRGVAGTAFASGQTTPHLRMDRTGASTSPDDNAYTFYKNIIIQSVRVTEENIAVTSYPNDYCTTTELVQDLIGAHTTKYDGLDAFIETVSDQITQFWYPNGTTVYDALNDLIDLNGAYYWAAWETIPRSGLWRFEFRIWPTTVRYECGIEDGWDQPGSANDLYNEVSVHWTDSKGRSRTTTRTSSVGVLTAAGLTRSARIDLGKENGSSAAAISAGDAFLTEHALPNRNGRLIVARAILDYDRGMMVDPAAIRPGGLIRVRGVTPLPGALNPGGRDGSTVFRIVGTEYRASDNSVQLELDTDAISTSRQIAATKQAATSSKRR